MSAVMPKRRRSRFRHFVVDHLRRAKGALALAALCMLGFTLAGLLAPWPLKIIFDYVLLDEPPPSSLSFLADVLQGGKLPALALISLAIVLLAVLRGAFSYAQLYLTSRVGYQLVYALRRELFVHLQSLSLSFHTRARLGELLSKLTGDTNNLKDVFAESALTVTGYVLILVGMFTVMFALNWRLSLIVLATFPVLFYALYYLYRKIKASAKRQRRSEGKVTSRISEILTAVSVVQAFGRERYEKERFETESGQTLEESVRTARMEASATRIVEIITAVGTWAVILVGSMQVLEGRMTPGDILIFVSYVTSLYKPIRGLAKLSFKASKAMVSAERIAKILEIEPEIQDDPQAVEASGLKGEVVFEEVSFDYGNGRGVLSNVSFSISPGQTVALVGSSGAGKSTIANLLLRFYDPQRGRILVDGTDVRRYKLASFREHIAVVLQESVLFCTTIRENIAYGKLDATAEEIIAATRAASAHDFILALEDGYDTVVGERGDTLSGGQRQRIAIARALIRNAPILILDEPMRGLDAESEAAVRQALKRLMAGKTCLLITHDLQAVAQADLVLVLDDGRICERGRHSELMARSGQYRQLYELKVAQYPARTASMKKA